MLSEGIHINNWGIANTVRGIKQFWRKKDFCSHIAQSQSWYVLPLTNVAKSQILHHRLQERGTVKHTGCCHEQEICKAATIGVQLTIFFSAFNILNHVTWSTTQLNNGKFVILATFLVTAVWAFPLGCRKELFKKIKNPTHEENFWIWWSLRKMRFKVVKLGVFF